LSDSKVIDDFLSCLGFSRCSNDVEKLQVHSAQTFPSDHLTVKCQVKLYCYTCLTYKGFKLLDMELKLCWVVLFFVPAVSPFGIGKREGLYGPEDVGILNLESGNFSQVVLGAKTAFIVEFYSSYCGHCINFAPAFKEFARQVAGKGLETGVSV